MRVLTAKSGWDKPLTTAIIATIGNGPLAAAAGWRRLVDSPRSTESLSWQPPAAKKSRETRQLSLQLADPEAAEDDASASASARGRTAPATAIPPTATAWPTAPAPPNGGPRPSRWPPASAIFRSASSSPRTATCWASTTRARPCSPRSRRRSTTRSTPAKRPASCPRSGSTSSRPATNRFKVGVQDNGPGIVKKQIPIIFGKLLYGSKFHRLRMSRGQQGIGISAAGMYGVLTTGKPVKIISQDRRKKPGPLLRDPDRHQEQPAGDPQRQGRRRRHPAGRARHEDDRQARHRMGRRSTHGTRVTIELEAKYQRGRGSVDEYLEQTAIANPHVTLHYIDPGRQRDRLLARSTDQLAAGAQGDQAAPVRHRAGHAGDDAQGHEGRDALAVSHDELLARQLRRGPARSARRPSSARGASHQEDRPRRSGRAVPGDSETRRSPPRRPIASRRSARSCCSRGCTRWCRASSTRPPRVRRPCIAAIRFRSKWRWPIGGAPADAQGVAGGARRRCSARATPARCGSS